MHTDFHQQPSIKTDCLCYSKIEKEGGTHGETGVTGFCEKHKQEVESTLNLMGIHGVSNRIWNLR